MLKPGAGPSLSPRRDPELCADFRKTAPSIRPRLPLPGRRGLFCVSERRAMAAVAAQSGCEQFVSVVIDVHDVLAVPAGARQRAIGRVCVPIALDAPGYPKRALLLSNGLGAGLAVAARDEWWERGKVYLELGPTGRLNEGKRENRCRTKRSPAEHENGLICGSAIRHGTGRF